MFPSFRKNGIFIEIYKEIFLFYESNERWVFTIRVSQRRSLFLSLSLCLPKEEKKELRRIEIMEWSHLSMIERMQMSTRIQRRRFFFFTRKKCMDRLNNGQITRKDIFLSWLKGNPDLKSWRANETSVLKFIHLEESPRRLSSKMHRLEGRRKEKRKKKVNATRIP